MCKYNCCMQPYNLNIEISAMMKSLATLTLTITIISCSSKKTYKYVETVFPPGSSLTFQDKDPEIIKAVSELQTPRTTVL